MVLLAIVGIYLLVFHADSLPANHEAIGLGKLHIVHDVFGIVLLIGAGWIVWRARGVAATN